ncbi:MAG: D-aminoacyl-tRNA deacylase [Eubacteriales bacterium]|nr:D-aminoacyl-tRNA deacylase [Eubacteriales bacterium]
MRSVIQRVSGASVAVDKETLSSIDKGLLVLLGVEEGDTDKDALYMADKICKLRIFEDEDGKMNINIKDAGGEIIVVSQFTLLGDARGQNRPSFIRAAKPQEADELYLKLVERINQNGIKAKTGKFQTHMMVSLVNDGPVTILLDSNKTF